MIPLRGRRTRGPRDDHLVALAPGSRADLLTSLADGLLDAQIDVEVVRPGEVLASLT